MKLLSSMVETALVTSRGFRKLARTVTALATEFEKLVVYVHSLSEAVERHEALLHRANEAYGEIVNEMHEGSLDTSLPDPQPEDKKNLPN